MKKKIVLLLLIVVLGALAVSVAYAANVKYTIAQVKDLPKNTEVTVQGEIKERVTDTHFVMKDATGDINLMIPEDVQKSIEFKPGEMHTVTGVLRPFENNLYIDVADVDAN